MRPLTLHVSALNDAEYQLYTESLIDLTVPCEDVAQNTVHDDAYYEHMIVGVREARAWLRGRYSDLAVSDIDSILKFFCPNMLQSDTLTGGQFFAALRLVIHAQCGKGIDRTLAFVQTHPSAKVPDPPQPVSPPKRQVSYRAPPSHPDRPTRRPTSSSSDTNPFTRRSLEQSRSAPESVEPPPVCPPRLPQKISHNPFLMRDKQNGVESPEKTRDAKAPPLLPQKPAPLPALSRRISSGLPPSANLITSSTSVPPRVPSKPSHIMSPLMRQSLQASKQGQNMKRMEDQLDKERVLQVLKSTSSSSSSDSSRTRSSSPTKDVYRGYPGSNDPSAVPPLPRRRTTKSPPSSSSESTASIEQVASATVTPFSQLSVNNPYRPALPSRDTKISTTDSFVTADSSLPPRSTSPLPVPPTHPDRRISNDNPDSPSTVSPRSSRSKSVHYPGAPPLPPPRRRRPESVQLTSTSSSTEVPALGTPSTTHTRNVSYGGNGLSRHLSLSREPDTSPIANLQRTLSSLQTKARPKLDVARYKAEAGLSKRGFVNHSQMGGPGARWTEEGEQGLMGDTRWAATDSDTNVDWSPLYYSAYPAPDTDDGTDDDRVRDGLHGTALRDYLRETDNLKWPAGDGWKPL
ncbi:hypothetical protein BJ138DRAFT_1147554 [Hygrophoropsis aurantiaca]|uniref:Uncharacterized protein n=1 Tax=Hygrophoropsis aurantiaca TaxID=72124 RepID=A0ACB8AJM3_9AGAM|nr:hypothetical protein BJ138DRAFT_1147554 [Hygrophoropsis aurantiaca]